MAELPKDMIYHFYSDDGITIKLDATELVRCGKCKHWDEESTFCLNVDGCYGKETTPNWFCADGKRREENE